MHPKKAIAVIADKDESFRAMLSSLLRNYLNFSGVTEVASFDEAVYQLGRTKSVAFLASDVTVPGMNVGNNLQVIREIFPTVRLAIVTDCPKREDIIVALSAGVHGYIAKDLPLDKIALEFRLILEGNISVPPSMADLDDNPVPAKFLAEDSAGPAGVRHLTPHQVEVLRLSIEHKSNKEIGKLLHLSQSAVRAHIRALSLTLDLNNRDSAFALQLTAPHDYTATD